MARSQGHDRTVTVVHELSDEGHRTVASDPATKLNSRSTVQGRNLPEPTATTARTTHA